MASLDSYFSVLALFILFRETIEASIICGVLMQFLNRSKPALKKAVWWGIAGGVGVSIIFGVIFIAIYYTAQNSLFSGSKRDWFKGVISWIAALLITILGFAMLRFLGWENKWKRKLAAAIASKVPEVVATPPADADAIAGQPAAAGDDAAPAAVPPAAVASAARMSSSGGSSSDDATGRLKPSEPSPPLEPQTVAVAASDTQPPPQSPSLAPLPALTTTSSSSESAAAATGGAKKGGSAPAIEAAAVDADSDKDIDKAALVILSADAVALDASEDPEKAAAGAAAEQLDPIDYTPATRRENLNIWLLVFTTVVREGIESVVFLGGLGNVKLSAIPLPAFVGIVCGCLVGIFLFYSGKQVKHIKWLVIIMAIIIFFIAAGQVSIGTDALMRAGLFGYCSPWLDERPWYMVPIYNWSKCCADVDPKGTEPTAVQNRMRFFALVRAIFGFQDKGTPTEIIAYCCYWGLVLILMAWKAWRGTLLDADYKHTLAEKKAAKEAARRAEEEEAARAREAAAAEVLEEGGAAGVAGEGEGGRPAVLGAAAEPVQRAAAPWWRQGCRGGGDGWMPCLAAKRDG